MLIIYFNLSQLFSQKSLISRIILLHKNNGEKADLGNQRP